MNGQLLRTLAISTRAIDEEKRTVELSWSSEEPYERWWGVEILDHSDGCVDLQRLSEIGPYSAVQRSLCTDANTTSGSNFSTITSVQP